MREIEIKVRIKDSEAAEKRLREMGCVLGAPVVQHDVIYALNGTDRIFKSSKEGDVVVRIRHLADGAELTLKQQKTGEMDNIEYETKIADAEVMDKILKKLGYQPVVEVLKRRQKGKLGAYAVCFDEVEKLGNFIELEKMTDEEADAFAVREKLFAVLEELGCSRTDEETRGYDTQMYQLQNRSK